MIKTKKGEVKSNYHKRPKKNETLLAAFSKTTSVRGRIRKIGNSKGLLLSNSMLKELGIAENAEVIVTTEEGRITIKPAENKTKINTDLSTWEAQFKAAIKSGDKPENDLFESMENKFDKAEW